MSAERKVAIVTGASQGIGAGLVKAFRDRDYRVVANSRSIKPSDDPDILAVAGDISKPETAKQIVSDALRRFGRIDSLINNAGIFIGKRFADYTEADFINMLSVNLAGFFYITQGAIAEMARQGSGHIVNITTSLVDQANSKSPSALASLTKGGLNSVVKSLAIEYAPRNVRVNAVAPGIIKTPMNPVESYPKFAGLHPLGRMGEVSDIVGAILYLESAGFVTGVTIPVDGGQSAGH
jgi:NAD(P)-dependent dehydrogenase (short-subunit alcohol dehydrogenase family)